MNIVSSRCAGVAGVVLVLAGCAAHKNTDAPVAQSAKPVACTPVSASDPMVGTWYSVSQPPGVAGNVQTLIVLAADGSMTYETQLKIGRRIRPALRESGCWAVADGIYTMQTTRSNGEPVDTADPIYQNRYRVEQLDGARLILRDLRAGGQVTTARRMKPGYRLPG